MFYQLVIRTRRAGRQTVGRPEDFDTTARNVAALFEEGYRKVDLLVLESRPATPEEVQSVVAAAKGLLQPKDC